MMSAPSSDETSDQRFSLRSATVLQLQTFRVICQPQDMEEEFVQWRISPIEVQMAPEETAPIHALVGDLAVGAGEWFVGATASMVFAASDDEVDETAMRGDLTAVAQRYGPPLGCGASTTGTLMQLFAVDGFGVRLYAGYSRVEVEIGQFKPMAEYEYG